MAKRSLHEQDKYTALDDWFKTAQGQRVADAFTAELKQIDTVLSGHRLLQLGVCGENPWLDILDFRHKWLVSPSRKSSDVTFYSSIQALPIERNSIDCIVAPLTMEAFTRFKNPINEIDRVLKPQGYVVFLGINPCSFWGIALRLGKVACFDHIFAIPTSSLTLKYRLFNRGYRQCLLTSFYYIPPFEKERLIHKMEFLNEMGKMIWPYPAGFYCLIMQKNEICMPNLQQERSDLYCARPQPAVF